MQRRWDGAKVSGRAREALMAGSGRSDGTASGGSPSAASAAALPCRAETEKGEREEEERERREVNVFDSRFSQNFHWKLEKI